MRRVTEGLLVRHAAGAPVVILGSKDDIRHFVGANLGLHGELLFAEVLEQAALERLLGVLFDRNSTIRYQVWMHMPFQITVSLLAGQTRRRILGIQVAVILITLHLTNLVLEFGAWRVFRLFVVNEGSWRTFVLLLFEPGRGKRPHHHRFSHAGGRGDEGSEELGLPTCGERSGRSDSFKHFTICLI